MADARYDNVLWVLDEMHDGDSPSTQPPADAEAIGHDGYAWIVVRDDGSVWAEHQHGATYVNASRHLFEETRRRFEARIEVVDRSSLRDDEVADGVGAELKQLVVEIDSTVADQFSWWLGVIDGVLL